MSVQLAAHIHKAVRIGNILFPWLQTDQPLCCIAVTCTASVCHSHTFTLNDLIIYSHSPDFLYLYDASGTFTAIFITLLTCEGPPVSDTKEQKLVKPVYSCFELHLCCMDRIFL